MYFSKILKKKMHLLLHIKFNEGRPLLPPDLPLRYDKPL